MTDVVACLDAGTVPDRPALRAAVRALLADLQSIAPGRSVEVRVPPYGAIQCVAGIRHTRGTPPNVVEMDAVAFVALATGRADWADLVGTGRISASGTRSDISHLFPIRRL